MCLFFLRFYDLLCLGGSLPCARVPYKFISTVLVVYNEHILSNCQSLALYVFGPFNQYHKGFCACNRRRVVCNWHWVPSISCANIDVISSISIHSIELTDEFRDFNSVSERRNELPTPTVLVLSPNRTVTVFLSFRQIQHRSWKMVPPTKNKHKDKGNPAHGEWYGFSHPPIERTLFIVRAGAKLIT